MPRAWISLGSNIEPRANLRAALKLLGSRFGPLVVSPVYRSPAEGFEGDDFLNLVVGIDTDQSLPEVRAALREIENARGRVRGAEKFSARTLDLDLLTWGELVDADRNLPRDEILEYAFVLRPLADVATDERHPVTGKSYAELWRDFPRKGRLLRVSL
jgi:2-amino-4-hydroxy-6-hydroxymethyldihydropteridine diphosphokinase